jgi:hypothetical protein
MARAFWPVECGTAIKFFEKWNKLLLTYFPIIFHNAGDIDTFA